MTISSPANLIFSDQIKWQAEVLDKEKSGIERKVKESLWIRKHGDNVMNLDRGYNVSKLWCGLFA